MECMCAQTRPRFILSSKRVLRNGVRNHVNFKGKKSHLWRLRGGLNSGHCIMHDSEPNTLPTELFRLTSLTPQPPNTPGQFIPVTLRYHLLVRPMQYHNINNKHGISHFCTKTTSTAKALSACELTSNCCNAMPKPLCFLQVSSSRAVACSKLRM